MIRSLGYLRFSSTDVGAWREFGVKVLGMVEGRGPEEEALYLRMDDFPARLVIVEGDEDRLLAAGWEVASSEELTAVALRLEEAGYSPKEGTAADCASRRVARLLHVTDPAGRDLEIFSGASLDQRPFVSAAGTRFVTGEMGLGHVVLPDPADGAAFHFYTEVLGFRLRDSMGLPGELFGKPAGEKMYMRFLGCCARHHSLALAPFPTGTSGVVHLMIEVSSLDEVGRALDRAGRRGATVAATLGRHANDHVVSFYLKAPGGFDIEYGTDGMLVDDTTWVARETTAISQWGHKWAVPGAAH
jgi:3,4-dihydroxy-9,10-secoandrosta-1,3,5(10)-triene-9,17-dione 4,5-dioxygenase